MRLKKKMIWGIVALGILGGVLSLSLKEEGLREQDFDFTTVKRNDIRQEVTASGTIQPINTVSVGTQVSGIVEHVLADYNDEVKKGQLLAQLDTSVLVENKNDAKARLDLAKVRKKIATLNYSRIDRLYQAKLIAKAALEEAEIKSAVAEAEVLTAQAEYNKASQNYDYAQITSPVSGTVISKEIEQGQTVAASLQTPTLFTVAEDLSKMQIEANIAEADIGLIRSGMPVTFSVDAYPSDVFDGLVKQVRLSPTEESNVVMYTVVIEVDNSSRKLLPGMTAFVTIVIEERKQVLSLSTSALQYKPNKTLRKELPKHRLDLNPDELLVYQFKEGHLVPTVFKKGLSDTAHVEVIKGLSNQDKVIIDYIPHSER